MIIKPVPSTVDLDFEVGKTYKTKFQTGELFTITKIITRPFLNTTKIVSFEGIYESHPHLGPCPLDVERLIPERKIVMVEDKQPQYTRKQLWDAMNMVAEDLTLDEFNEILNKI